MEENRFFAEIEISDEKLNDIFRRMEEARQIIYQCSAELRELSVVRISEKTASGN